MLIPEYIPGTSLYGYYNQFIAINSFPSRFLLSSRQRTFKRRNSPAYIEGMLTETYSGSLASSLGDIFPESTVNSLQDSAQDVCGPFIPNYSTYKTLFDPELKYCPECMKAGKHYYYQQLKTEGMCRNHLRPLQKGCPICGARLSSCIDVTNLDAYVCPECFNRFAGFDSSAELATRLFDVKINEDNVIVYRETKGYLGTMKGSENVLHDPQFHNILNNYLKTGEKPNCNIVIKKGIEAQISLPEMVYPYTNGKLHSGSTRVDMTEYASNDSASAYLVRKLIGSWNPRRLEVVPLKDTQLSINRALKDAGIGENTAIVKAILKRYISDMYTRLTNLFDPGVSLQLLVHKKVIFEVSYAFMILEDDEYYYVYLYD